MTKQQKRKYSPLEHEKQHAQAEERQAVQALVAQPKMAMTIGEVVSGLNGVLLEFADCLLQAQRRLRIDPASEMTIGYALVFTGTIVTMADEDLARQHRMNAEMNEARAEYNRHLHGSTTSVSHKYPNLDDFERMGGKHPIYMVEPVSIVAGDRTINDVLRDNGHVLPALFENKCSFAGLWIGGKIPPKVGKHLRSIHLTVKMKKKKFRWMMEDTGMVMEHPMVANGTSISNDGYISIRHEIIACDNGLLLDPTAAQLLPVGVEWSHADPCLIIGRLEPNQLESGFNVTRKIEGIEYNYKFDPLTHPHRDVIVPLRRNSTSILDHIYHLMEMMYPHQSEAQQVILDKFQ